MCWHTLWLTFWFPPAPNLNIEAYLAHYFAPLREDWPQSDISQPFPQTYASLDADQLPCPVDWRRLHLTCGNELPSKNMLFLVHLALLYSRKAPSGPFWHRYKEHESHPPSGTSDQRSSWQVDQPPRM